MFLERLSIEFSAATFWTFNELIFVFQTVSRFFDRLLHNFLLLIGLDSNRLLLHFVDRSFVIIGRGFDFFFDWWFNLGFGLFLLFLDENSFLGWLLWSDLDLRFFLIELGRIIEYKFQVSFLMIGEFEGGFSIAIVIFFVEECLSGGVWEVGFVGSGGSFDSAFEESGGGSSSHVVH